MSSSSEMKSALDKLLIPFEEINFATNGFDKKNLIGDGGFGPVYKGQLSERWGNRTAAIKRRDPDSYQGKQEFENEIQMVSRFHHENIISFIGYCDEDGEMIIVYEYAINGSLDHHLQDISWGNRLTWAERLIICMGAARGLKYLHSGLGDNNRIIHRDVKSSNILLDDNFEAKLSDFGLSRSTVTNQPLTHVYTSAAGTPFYLDPFYRESGILTKESDVFSLGVVFFEMLCGMLAYHTRSIGDDNPQTLINLVRQNFDVGLDKIIDPNIRDEINSRSLKTFTRVAYNSISYNIKERPKMDRIIKEIEKALEFQLEGYLIPLEKIKLGTNKFHQDNYLGGGEFCEVYRGTFPEWPVCIKRLNPTGGVGKWEFMKELSLLSTFRHKNIISFAGYCYDGDKMIMAFSYAKYKSLNQYLKGTNKMRFITWEERLGICIDIAEGLDHLHTGLRGNRRIIHGDVRSANILLHDNWTAEISEFASSKLSSRDQLNTIAVGTDPHYHASNILTEESDVYSFGVVLIEVLCAKLVFSKTFKEDDDKDDSPNLVELDRHHRDNLHMIIDPHIKDHINAECLDMFTGIAFQCLERDYKKRPTMSVIREKLGNALYIQERQWEKLLPDNYQKIIDRSYGRVVYRNKQELCSLLSAGIFIDDGKKWYSLSKMNKKSCVIISAMDLFAENDKHISGWVSSPSSRFSHVACFQNAGVRLVHEPNMNVTTSTLSLGSTYAVFIICRYIGNEHKDHTKCSQPDIYFHLYCGDELLYPYSAEWKDEVWMEVELFQFTNNVGDPKFELHLRLNDSLHNGLYVESIEFRPIEMATNEEDTTHVDRLLKLESDADWEKMLPNHYEDIISRSEIVVQFSTKEELYYILVNGIYLDDKSMFRLDESNGKICVMLSTRFLTIKHLDGVEENYTDDTSSYFKVEGFSSLEIGCKINAHMLSPKTPYSAWLLYEHYDTYGMNIAYLTLGDQEKKTRHVYFHETSKIIRPLNDPKYERYEKISSGMVKLDRRWFAGYNPHKSVELFPFFNDMDANDEVEVGLHITPTDIANNIIILGIDFQPQ